MIDKLGVKYFVKSKANVRKSTKREILTQRFIIHPKINANFGGKSKSGLYFIGSLGW
jgi:uncharacterized protein involved in copper resistance|tara:strand:+ start:772 stop:942 length:171 start_codon:yes stop_codon:yes gene_type:complete